VNVKFGQKLDFLERMTRWSEECACPTIMVGDFNVAPLECDVWSHKQLINVVSHTPVEVEALGRLQAEQRVGRSRPPLLPGSAAAPHLVELSLARLDEERSRAAARPYVGHRRRGAQAVAHVVHEPCRAWTRPSDHVPLLTEFRL
jgi:exodeoxyribonuclease-3